MIAGEGGVDAVAQFLGRPAGGSGQLLVVDVRVRRIQALVAPGEHAVAVAGDLLADEPAFLGCGGGSHARRSGSADAVLDAVEGQQLAQAFAQHVGVLAVHQGSSGSSRSLAA